MKNAHTAGQANNNLVIYSLVDSFGYYGLILGQSENLTLVYNFESEETSWVVLNISIPCGPDNYSTMCKKGWWNGVVVRISDGTLATVLNGQMEGEICKLYCEPEMSASSSVWVPLDKVILVGHRNCKILEK